MCQEPSSVDLDDKGFCCPFLQNYFGSCNHFVLLLYLFSHVALQWMLMLLMRHVFGILGYKFRNPPCGKVFTIFFACNLHSIFYLCKRRKYHNARSAHMNTPGGLFYSRFESSATSRLRRRRAQTIMWPALKLV